MTTWWFYPYVGQNSNILQNVIQICRANTSGEQNDIPGQFISSWGRNSGLIICPEKGGRNIRPEVLEDRILRTITKSSQAQFRGVHQYVY